MLAIMGGERLADAVRNAEAPSKKPSILAAPMFGDFSLALQRG
jgi:hypothetical protein